MSEQQKQSTGIQGRVMRRACVAGAVIVVALAVFVGAVPSSRTRAGGSATAATAGTANSGAKSNAERVGLETVRYAEQENASLSTSFAANHRSARTVAARSRRANARVERIAFTSNRTGTAQIWMMNADGSNQTRVTHSHPMEDIQPEFSPDGRRIAFSRAVPASYESANLVSSEIWVVDADGSDEERLATAPGTINFRPQWSPDGREILFVRGTPAQAPFDIWIMDADGKNQRALTTNGTSTYPTWSPDGKQIAFLSGLQVWVMDADGTNAHQITTVGPNYVPSWAPGSRILFTSTRDGGGRQIYVMDADGSNQTRLAFTDGEDKMPTWSPDGRKIAFSRGNRECGSEEGSVVCQAGNGYEIHTMNADGSGIRRVTFTEIPERQWGENYPVWQPCRRDPRRGCR